MARYAIITFGILFFAGLIVTKLFRTTVIDADKWNKKAQVDLSVTEIINPKRGNILADDGSIMVTNLTYYDVRIDYRCEGFAEKTFLDSLNVLCDSMALVFPQKTAAEWRDLLSDPMALKKEKRPRALRILKEIEYDELQRLKKFPFFNINRANKTGITVQDVSKRVSAYGNMARRSIGHVTFVGKELRGYSGLEKSLDTLLYGIPGVYKRVPLTRKIGNWTDIPAVDGYDVRTTINVMMQDLLEEELHAMLDTCQADWGTAILMEVKTGDIKAMANLERDDRGEYIEAYNRAVVAYEPGSVVKPISLMIALEDGVVNNVNEVFSTGASYAYAGGKPIRDSHVSGSKTVSQIITHSSNIGMTKIIDRGYGRNPAHFVERLESIGMFDKMNSGIAEEETPRIKRNPGRIDLSRMSYGYTTAIPPLYTLSYYNAIANGGVYVRPRLVSAVSRDGIDSIIPVSYIRDRICSEENAAKLRAMLTGVVEDPDGTAKRLKNSTVKLAGKTGTCKAIDFSAGRYMDGVYRLAFCGFFPADNPKYSMMVLTYHPRRNFFGAPTTSGEVFKNMALKLYARGLLDENCDYRTENSQGDSHPTLTATQRGAYSGLLAHIGSTGASMKSIPSDQGNAAVPTVLNLGLREAIARLEAAGYEVKFRGEGHVVDQRLITNRMVELTLQNK